MRFKGFIGPSYELRSLSVECQRCINLYPELDEAQTEKDGEVAALISTPGKRFLATVGDGPIRGIYLSTRNTLYVVSGNELYQIWPLWRAQLIGTLSTSSGPVSMADNYTDLFIVDGDNGYYTAMSVPPSPPGVLTKTVDPNWQGADFVVCADGMFVFNVPGTFEFYVSEQLSTTINPLGLASRVTPDPITGMVWDKRNLWLLGQRSSEIWFNSGVGVNGTTSNPFQAVQGGYIEAGCSSFFSVQQLGNTFMWLGQDPRGVGMVMMADGYNPKRVSNHSVEIALQSYGDMAGAVAWTHQEDGHNFYMINLVGSDSTWAYDLTSGMWHERCYLEPTTGTLTRDRAQFHALYRDPRTTGNEASVHVVGDFESGNIYALEKDCYTDGGDPIMRRRASPHLSNDMNRVFVHKVQLDFQPGTSADGSGQGSDPRASLQWSDDGGYTWSNERWVSIGKLGEYKRRAIWRRVGQGRNRVFRISVTDPVEVIMIGAEIDASSGSS